MKKLMPAVAGIAVLVAGCDKSTDPSSAGTLSLSSAYSTSAAPSPAVVSLGKKGGTAVPDSVTITQVRIVLRDIKFKSVDDSLNFKSEPSVVTLNIGGSTQNVTVQEVPFRTYSRIEFDVHRVESSLVAQLPPAEQTAFADFLAGERYSVIVDGIVYTSGSGTAYRYRSKIDAKQKIDLVPELVVSEGSPDANVTLLLSSEGWFRNASGTLVDPSDPNSEGVIDENIKSSIRVFKDNNRDGSKDNN